MLLGINIIGRYCEMTIFQKHSTIHKGLKVISYNVRIFNYYNWEKENHVAEKILNFIANQDPSLVCMQEFLAIENHSNQSLHYIDSKLSLLPYNHVYYSFIGKNSINYGLATYSKYPIIKKGSIRFKNSFNACIYSDVVIKSDTFRIFNAHLQSIKFHKNDYNFMDSLLIDFNSNRFSEAKDISGRLRQAYIKRSQQADEINKYIRRSPYPVIVCGDFNDTPVSYTYQTIRDNLEDAFVASGTGIGNSYRGSFPSYRIDFILYSKGIKSVRYQTYPVKYSDHYPIGCELNFEKH